jgi:hypothetical protein
MNAQTSIEGSLASAMAAAFAEIEGATKSANNPHFKSKYADISAVIEAIKPALINHDLFFTQCPEPVQDGIQIETVLHHAGGEHLSLGKLFVPANKKDAQGFGSALTYARRYALVTAFGVPTEDDDGNAATKAQKDVPSVVDDNQWSIITQLIEATGTDARKFCQAYRIDSVKALPAGMFGKAEAQLKRKLAGMERETADA